MSQRKRTRCTVRHSINSNPPGRRVPDFAFMRALLSSRLAVEAKLPSGYLQGASVFTGGEMLIFYYFSQYLIHESGSSDPSDSASTLLPPAGNKRSPYF